MEYTTRVKVFVEDTPSEWISGVMVCLYDRDLVSRDDHLGTEVTNTYGEANFRFTDDQFLDLDDRIGGVLPDLFVEIYSSEGARVLTTRAKVVRNTVPDLIRVPVPRDLAEQHHLI